MKGTHNLSIMVFTVLLILTVVATGQDTPTTQSADAPAVAGQSTAKAHAQAREAAKPAAPVKRPYMGLTVRLLEPDAGQTLGLPDEVGLTVEYVDPYGPAVSVFKRGDVIHKLGDQMLINPHQMRVLLWMHKPGDAVTLHCYRKGKAQSIKLTLGERPDEVPVIPAPNQKVQAPQPGVVQARASRVMLFRDGEHMLRVSEDEKGRHLSCKDYEGNVVYDGYIDTEADRAALPEAVREKLGKMQRLQKVRGIEIERAPLLPPDAAEPTEKPSPPREQAENESTEG